MTELFHFKQPIDLKGFTLIIPCVSVANIPQLTVDLLITCYDFKKIGTVWHPGIVPSVGGDPYESNSTEICTACEFYANEQLRLCLIQFRSTLDCQLTKKFIEDFKNDLLKLNLGSILILGSGYDYDLHIPEIGKFYFLSNETNEAAMLSLEVRSLKLNNYGRYEVNGSGYALNLYMGLSSVMPCTIIFRLGSEGDNRPDALKTLELVGKYLDALKDEPLNIKYPSSWKYVFGGPPPMGIY